jgi:Uma2 family endonuclease
MGIGDRHTACVKRLNRLLGAVVGDRYLVSIQDPIRLSDSEPEPDCAVVTYRGDFYSLGKPIAGDVSLLVEVADSSLDLDRGAKLSIYAQADIHDYWIVNVVDDIIEVHRRPQSNGIYGERWLVRRGETISPLAWPEMTLSADDILGPASAG